MKQRDGVWTSNGLRADFILLYVHPNAPNLYRVSTAAGDCYACGEELTWDYTKQNAPKEHLAEMRKAIK